MILSKMGAEPNTENFYDKLAESYKFVSESKQLFNTAIDAAIIGDKTKLNSLLDELR